MILFARFRQYGITNYTKNANEKFSLWGYQLEKHKGVNSYHQK